MRSRKESGFSLIEVMITSFILAIGLLGIVALQGIAKKSLADTDKQIEASFHARTAMEELRADTRWIAVVSGPINEKMIQDILRDTTLSAERSHLSLCYYVNSIDQMMTISVSWQMQNKPAAAAKGNGVACGVEVTHRRQVLFTSLIVELYEF